MNIIISCIVLNLHMCKDVKQNFGNCEILKSEIKKSEIKKREIKKIFSENENKQF